MGIAPNTTINVNSVSMNRPRKLPGTLEELVFEPTLERTPQGAVLMAQHEDRNITPWGLWGAALTAVIGFLLLSYEGYRGFHDWNTVVVSVAILALALLMARFGRKNSMVPVQLAEINLIRRELTLPTSPPTTLVLDDIQELVYAMVRYPISNAPNAVKVEAYSVLVRTPEGDLLPLIEASPHKTAVFGFARAMSQWTGQEITHVGIGVK